MLALGLLAGVLLGVAIGIFLGSWIAKTSKEEGELVELSVEDIPVPYTYDSILAGVNYLGQILQKDPPPWREADRTMKMLRSTCVDIQGFIELCSRYLVMQMPAEALEEFEPPEHWMKKEAETRG